MRPVTFIEQWKKWWMIIDITAIDAGRITKLLRDRRGRQRLGSWTSDYFLRKYVHIAICAVDYC